MEIEPDQSEEEELDQILKDIRNGCCLGDPTETGDPPNYGPAGQVSFWRSSDGTHCFSADKALVDRLLSEGRLKFDVEPYPGRGGERRRVYRVEE